MDYKIDMIPPMAAGQVYVLLSKSGTDASDENVISGPAILEVGCCCDNLDTRALADENIGLSTG